MDEVKSDVAVREFEDGDEAAFRRLNVEWIEQHFKIEAKDEYVFAKPRETILDKGGRIFFAMLEGEAVGCCALMAMGPGEFEVAKMAVTERVKGRGLGRLLLAGVIEAARASGATRLYLETNHVLTPAVRLYESLGFVRLAAEGLKPSPYARTDVFMELRLV